MVCIPIMWDNSHGPAVDCDILLLPIHVQQCRKCANMVAYTMRYSSAANTIQSYHICKRYLRTSFVMCNVMWDNSLCMKLRVMFANQQ